MVVKTKKGKQVDIPDDELDRFVDQLDISLAEAIDLWLTDNDLEVNEEQEQLDKKAKDSRTMGKAPNGKTSSTPTRKQWL